jgi:hypothetical protein
MDTGIQSADSAGAFLWFGVHLLPEMVSAKWVWRVETPAPGSFWLFKRSVHGGAGGSEDQCRGVPAGLTLFRV